MSIEEFVNKLGITQKGQMEGDYYIIHLNSSDEYSNVYATLDNLDFLDLDISNIKLDDSMNQVTYFGDEFDVILKANFDDDVYTVAIK